MPKLETTIRIDGKRVAEAVVGEHRASVNAAVDRLVARMRAGETGGYGSHIERDLLALKR